MGTYREHATKPMIEPQAWIIEKQDSTWRLMADGERYTVQRVVDANPDRSL